MNHVKLFFYTIIGLNMKLLKQKARVLQQFCLLLNVRATHPNQSGAQQMQLDTPNKSQ